MNFARMLNPLEQLLLMLEAEIQCPEPWGMFHIVSLGIVAILIVFLYQHRKTHSEEQLKLVLGMYSVIALLLEVGKQLIWSFNYDIATQVVTWDYQWYAAPFQLCTTPMYVCLVCLFLKKGKIRDTLLSYVAYITILGSMSMMILPDSCFSTDLLVTVHTTYLHFGSFVVSVYLLMSGEVLICRKALMRAVGVFLAFVLMANLLNDIVYQSGVLAGETFNMFYISQYFVSVLPVFSTIQPLVPYAVFLLLYITALCTGGFVVYNIAFLCECYWKHLHIPGFTMKQAKYFH